MIIKEGVQISQAELQELYELQREVIEKQNHLEELKSNGAHIIRALEDRPWSCKDFYVADPDGYLLCFSEETAEHHDGADNRR